MSAEARGWVRVAASIAAFAVIGTVTAAGLYALVLGMVAVGHWLGAS